MKLWLVFILVAGSGCLTGDSVVEFHEALLQDTYAGVMVEVDYVEGFKPSPETLRTLETKLHELTDKEVVIVAAPTPMPRQASQLDREDLVDIHRATKDRGPADHFAAHGWVHLHILFTNGLLSKADSNGHVIGTTLQDEGAIFIFKERYQLAYRIELSQKVSAVAEVERVVLLHELGHAMGLVNYGTPMVDKHAHDEHNRHSSNPESVMFPIIPLASHGLVYAPLPLDFDSDDLQDLAALRARG